MSSSKLFRNVIIGGAVAAGTAAWALAPRSFNDKRRNFVPSVPDAWYAHRGLHDAGIDIVSTGSTAKKIAAENGIHTLRLDCCADRVKLRHFYEKHGFQYTGTITDVAGYELALYVCDT